MAQELSTDQDRYRDIIVARTGMDSQVMRAWIGCESGWSVTKPSHNYLNIGPGRSYRSTDEAAEDAVHEINRRRFGDLSAGAQVNAIAASDWGTGPGCLVPVAVELGIIDAPTDDFGLPIYSGGKDVAEGAKDLASAVPNAIIDGLGKLLAPLGRVLLIIVLSGLFTAGGLGLIALGLNRLTGKGMSERVKQATDVAGAATAVAAL